MGWPLPPDDFFVEIANNFTYKTTRSLDNVTSAIWILFPVLVALQAATVWLLYKISVDQKYYMEMLHRNQADRQDARGSADKPSKARGY
jgi:hypothetical protein